MAHFENITVLSSCRDSNEETWGEDVQCSKRLRCGIAFEIEHVLVNSVLLILK